MVYLFLFPLATLCGCLAAHYNSKVEHTKGFKAFFFLCLCGAVLGTIMLFSFLAPIWISYVFLLICIAIAANSISNYRKSLAGK